MVLYTLVAFLYAIHMLFATQPEEPGLEAKAGFDGVYEVGMATPIVVRVRNEGPPIEGELRVESGDMRVGESASISLPTGSDKQVTLIAHLSSLGPDVSVQLVDGGNVIAETEIDRLRPVSREDLFYGVASSDPGHFAFLEAVSGGRIDATVGYVDLRELPEIPAAWSGLDILVLDDIDTSRLTDGQSAALRTWIEDGGHLIVTGGAGGLQTAAGLAELLPVAVGGVESIDDLAALGDFAGTEIPGAGPYVISSAVLTGGVALVEQDRLPIVAQRNLGRGKVTFIAADPKLAPLAGWEEEAEFWSLLAGDPPDWSPLEGSLRNGFMPAEAVSYIPGLRLPSVAQLVAFAFLYTLVIGPLNYLFLRRLKRLGLAWITIPALVLAFSAATFLTGFRARGNATVNLMSVATGSIDAQHVHVQSVLGLYSPRRDRHDISLPDGSTINFVRGDLGSRAWTDDLEAIARGEELTLRGVRTDTGDLAVFLVESYQPRPSISAGASLLPTGDVIEVTIRNDSGTVLENAVLIHGADQHSVGELRAGDERTVQVPISAGGQSPAPGPDPLFPAAAYRPHPLLSDPGMILGTPNYFEDPVAYSRWQLINAYLGDQTSDATGQLPTGRNIILAGWLAEPALEANLSEATAEKVGDTLVLLEIPIR